MKENLNISLEILLLNDLYLTKVIDKEIYDKATQKLTLIVNDTHTNENSEIHTTT